MPRFSSNLVLLSPDNNPIEDLAPALFGANNWKLLAVLTNDVGFDRS